jgi:dynamin 1-like protein
MLHLVSVKEIERFHKLYRRIFNVMEELLDQCLRKTEDMIKQIIEIEMGYINNNHPDFIETLTTVQTHEKQQNHPQAEEEK